MTQREIILNAVNWVCDLKENGVDIFFNYSPHTNQIDFRYYLNGFDFDNLDNESVYRYVYLDWPNAFENYVGAKKEIEEVILSRSQIKKGENQCVLH